MDAIIVTSATPIADALDLGGGVYEVIEQRLAVKDAKGEPVKDEQGREIYAVACVVPPGAVELTKAADRAAAIRPRFDLSPSHPLYGLPARAAGLSGQGDELMGSDGAWHPVRDQRDVDELIAAGLVRREVAPGGGAVGEVKPEDGRAK